MLFSNLTFFFTDVGKFSDVDIMRRTSDGGREVLGLMIVLVRYALWSSGSWSVAEAALTEAVLTDRGALSVRFWDCLRGVRLLLCAVELLLGDDAT